MKPTETFWVHLSISGHFEHESGRFYVLFLIVPVKWHSWRGYRHLLLRFQKASDVENEQGFPLDPEKVRKSGQALLDYAQITDRHENGTGFFYNKSDTKTNKGPQAFIVT
jgi:hypothetical protein